MHCSVEDFARAHPVPFDVIVMADVVEHAAEVRERSEDEDGDDADVVELAGEQAVQAGEIGELHAGGQRREPRPHWHGVNQRDRQHR